MTFRIESVRHKNEDSKPIAMTEGLSPSGLEL